MTQTLSHPAIDVALAAVADARFPGEFAATAIRLCQGAAAVVLDSDKARFVLFVEDRDGMWTAPGMIGGGPVPEGPRLERTPEDWPLKRMARKKSGHPVIDGEWPDECWFAVTGLAAEDATEIAIIVDGHEHREPIGEDGLAFAIARIRTVDEPAVVVHTRDGRAVSAMH